MIYEFKGHRPVVDPSAFVHPQAAVTGNVWIGKNVYIGPGAALRGDWGRIVIEDGCNVQESCTIHMFPGVTVLLKEGAHIGHGAIVHGAVIGKNCLIGMNSVIMDNAEIGDECIVGALSFIKAGEKVPPRSVIAGNPAKILREVSDEMLKWKTEGTALYQALPEEMRKGWRECEPDKNDTFDSSVEAIKTYRTWKETSENVDKRIEEPAASYKRRLLTVDEFLEMEEKSVVKHEYYKGRIFAMSEPKLDHNRITINLSALLASKLQGSGCEFFDTNIRVYVESNDLLTYPDLSIVCGEPITRNNDDSNLLNPCLVTEVLSESTMDYDRNEKFELYKGLPTFMEYILVDSRTISVEQFFKNAEGPWTPKSYKLLSDNLVLKTVAATLPLNEIYKNVRLLKQKPLR